MQNNTIKEKYNKKESLYYYVLYVDSHLSFIYLFQIWNNWNLFFSDTKFWDKFLTWNFIIDLKRCYFVKNMSIKCLFKIWKLLCPLNLTCVYSGGLGAQLVHALLEILDPSLVCMGYRILHSLRISRIDSLSASN